MASQNNQHSHQHPDFHIGVLLVNLGTPESATPAAVRKFLAEFLWDPRVVEIPRLPWWFILNGFILPFRPKAVAANYQKIWLEDGSPLMVYSKAQARKVHANLQSSGHHQVKVALGMRYGSPSISDALDELQRYNITKLMVLPLYPQYSATTTGTVFDKISEVVSQWRWIPELRMVNHYADHPLYIDTIANSIETHWSQHGKNEKLLFSFHGLPKRNLALGDPYYCFCHKTTRLVAEKLSLAPQHYQLVFQSRFGKAEWLQPYCDKTLESLAQQGTNSVDVVCPGFAADCLETLEEIDIENRQIFLTNGGKKYSYIPALNASDAHVDLLSTLTKEHMTGWL